MPVDINNLANTFTAYMERNDISFPAGFIPTFLQRVTDSLRALKTAMENGEVSSAFTALVVLDSLDSNLQSRKIEQFLVEEGQQKIAGHIAGCVQSAFAQICTPDVHPHQAAVKQLVERQAAVWAAYFYTLISVDQLNLDVVFKNLANYVTNDLIKGVMINGEHDIYTPFNAKLIETLHALEPYIEVETDISALTDMIKNCLPNGCKTHDENPLQSHNPIQLLSALQLHVTKRIQDQYNAATVADSLRQSLPKHVKHKQTIQTLISTATPQNSYIVFSKNYLAYDLLKQTLKAADLRSAEHWLHTILVHIGMPWAFEALKHHKDGELLHQMSDIMLERQLEQLQPYYTLPENIFRSANSNPKPKMQIT